MAAAVQLRLGAAAAAANNLADSQLDRVKGRAGRGGNKKERDEEEGEILRSPFWV